MRVDNPLNRMISHGVTHMFFTVKTTNDNNWLLGYFRKLEKTKVSGPELLSWSSRTNDGPSCRPREKNQ